METSAPKRAKAGAFDGDGLARFLARQHPAKTAAAVAALGVAPARTVQHWLAGRATPSAAAFGRLIIAYGPGVLAAAVPGLAWIDLAAALIQRDAILQQLDALDARREAAVRELTKP